MNPPRKRPKRQATNSRTPAILVSRMYPHRLPAVHMPRQSSREYIALTALTLAAFALRIWRLDAKGLGYDEAATAIMARAPIADIISFHWEAAFEHLPLWVLLMRRLVSACRSIRVLAALFACVRRRPYRPAVLGATETDCAGEDCVAIADDRTDRDLACPDPLRARSAHVLAGRPARRRLYLLGDAPHPPLNDVPYGRLCPCQLGHARPAILLRLAYRCAWTSCRLCRCAATCDAAFLRPGGDACRRRFSGSLTAVDGPIARFS